MLGPTASLCLYVNTAYGKNVKAMVEQPLEEEPMHEGRNTVTYEARQLKALMLRMFTY